jgi:hypothetical protein
MSRLHDHAPGADPVQVKQPNIKGLAMLDLVKFLRTRRDEVLAMLRPELHHYLSETLSASTWYPEADHAEMLGIAAKLYTGSPDRALELMGEFAARSHSEIYHELLVGRGSPSRAFAMWSSQHDTGELRRTRESANRMSFELVDFEGASRELCLLFTGYLRGTFLVNNFADVTIEKTNCTLWGDASCLWRCSWKRG